MIELTDKTAAIHEGLIFPSTRLSSDYSFWAAQAYCICHTLNSAVTTSNPLCMAPYGMWYGKVPPSPSPFLKLSFVKRERSGKIKPKAVSCQYIVPLPNRSSSSMRIVLRAGLMIDSRHVTWMSELSRSVPARVSRCEDKGNTPAGLRPKKVESSEEEMESSESDEDCESEGAKRKPVHAETDITESDDEVPIIFPWVAPMPVLEAAPMGRPVQF